MIPITEGSLPPDTRRHPGATTTGSSFTPQWTLRHDNLVLWGRGYWVKSSQLSYTHQLHTHIWKCYMGFCTSRRTVIDFKKKHDPDSLQSVNRTGRGTLAPHDTFCLPLQAFQTPQRKLKLFDISSWCNPSKIYSSVFLPTHIFA